MAMLGMSKRSFGVGGMVVSALLGYFAGHTTANDPEAIARVKAQLQHDTGSEDMEFRSPVAPKGDDPTGAVHP